MIISIQGKKGLDSPEVRCKVEVDGTSSQMDELNPAKILLKSHSPTTAVSFALSSPTGSVATARVTFNALLGDQRRSERWIKFKDPSGGDIRLKIFVVLAEPQEPINLSITKRHESQGNIPVCPAVNNLFREKTPELEELWKNRSGFGDFLTEKTVKITFEPMATAKEVPIKISTIDNLRPEVLEKSCGECIKAIKDLAFDVNHLKASVQDLPALREQFSAKIDERLQEESLSQEFFFEVTNKAQVYSEEIEGLLREERELARQIEEEEEYQRKTLVEIDEMQMEYEYISRENIIIRAEKLKNNDLDQVIKRLEEDLHNCTQKLQVSEGKYQKIQENIEIAKESMQKNLEKLTSELEAAKAAYESSTHLNEELSSRNSSLQEIYESLKSNAKCLDSLKSSLSDHKSSKSLFLLKKDQLLKDLSQFSSQVSGESAQTKEKFQQIIKSQSDLLQSLPAASLKLEETYGNSLASENKLSSMMKTQTTLEQECCIRADLNQLIEDYSSLEGIYKTSRAGILKALDSGCDYILKESDKVLDECKKIDTMMDSIDDKEFEIENMRTVLAEIKNRLPQYVPIEDDPIDIALSEYLNSCDLPVSIPFKREEEGIYVFGTKKVFLKLENGTVKIRVGGGYTKIEEFIEIYAPIELERQEEAIENTCPQLSTTFTRFQTGAKGMSPLRAARIIQTAVEAINQGSPAKATVRSKSKKN